MHGVRSLTRCAAASGVPKSAYIHLPFCKRRCFYCDFPIEAVGSNLTLPRTQSRFDDYVHLLLKEIAATAPTQPPTPLDTIYFGGGTPSLLPLPALQTILTALDTQFGIASDAEVSMEADPGTFDVQRLRDYRAMGINRVSIGVQAFQEDLLKACGRAHTLDDVYRAVEAVHSSGMPTWSLDLISGLPHLKVEHWQHSLEEAIRAGPTHVSTYDLQVEEGTPFAKWFSPGEAPLPQEDVAAEMYRMASTMLRGAGYEHYEVSNYAKPGHRCRHNQTYWRGDPHMAFGLGAASYLDGRRFSRPAKMKTYAAWVERYAAGPAAEEECSSSTSEEEVMLDTVMLSLRTADGLDVDRFQRRFGAAAATIVRRVAQGHAALGLVHPFSDSANSTGADARRTEAMAGAIASTSGTDGPTGRTPGRTAAEAAGGEATATHLRNSGGSVGLGGTPRVGTIGSSSLEAAGAEQCVSTVEDRATPLVRSVAAVEPCGVVGGSGTSVALGSGEEHATSSEGRSAGAGGEAHRKADCSSVLTTRAGDGASGEASDSNGRLLVAAHSVIRLTDPEGFLLSNSVISDVFAALSDCAATRS